MVAVQEFQHSSCCARTPARIYGGSEIGSGLDERVR